MDDPHCISDDPSKMTKEENSNEKCSMLSHTYDPSTQAADPVRE